ncbi:MAG: RNA polymerase sigma factor [Oscillospiraceae bacterium]
MFGHFFKKHKEKEFEKIIIKYTPYVSTIVYNIGGRNLSSQDIEDITSNVFIAVWQKNVNLKVSNFKSYLAGMTRNITLNYLRTIKNVYNLDDEVIISTNNLVEDFEKKELSKIIDELVNDMKEPDRSIFIKYYWFGNDTKKIAEDLQLNRSTVMSKLSRNREKLKKELIERGYNYEKI